MDFSSDHHVQSQSSSSPTRSSLLGDQTPKSSVKTSPEKKHDPKNQQESLPLGEPATSTHWSILLPSANAAEWLAKNWKEISAKAKASHARLSVDVLVYPPHNPDLIETVIKVSARRQRSAAKFAMTLAEASGFGVVLDSQGRGDTGENDEAGDDEDAGDDDETVGRRQRGEGEGAPGAEPGSNTDLRHLDSMADWCGPGTRQKTGTTIRLSTGILSLPPGEVDTTVEVSIHDMARWRVNKAHTVVSTTRGIRLMGTPSLAHVATIASAVAHNAQLTVGTTGARVAGFPLSMALGRTKTETVAKPEPPQVFLESIGTPLTRLASDWRFVINSPRPSGQSTTNLKIDVSIRQAHGERLSQAALQPLRIQTFWTMGGRGRHGLPFQEMTVLIHEVKIANLHTYLPDQDMKAIEVSAHESGPADVTRISAPPRNSSTQLVTRLGATLLPAPSTHGFMNFTNWWEIVKGNFRDRETIQKILQTPLCLIEARAKGTFMVYKLGLEELPPSCEELINYVNVN
ncbi:hypothetical protein DFH09DRAFT_1355469 [Mycena vulgaris]|nr:hypothetical protein DFH09DRAFT_1355469 [Mycena vulgaris]